DIFFFFKTEALAIETDLIAPFYLVSHFIDHLPVDRHTAGRDIGIGFPAGADARIGDISVQTNLVRVPLGGQRLTPGPALEGLGPVLPHSGPIPGVPGKGSGPVLPLGTIFPDPFWDGSGSVPPWGTFLPGPFWEGPGPILPCGTPIPCRGSAFFCIGSFGPFPIL